VGESSPQSAGLRRDLEVLTELASEESLRRGGLGVVRIAERLGREKSQVSRALRALEAEQMVERDPRTRTFQLGPALYTLAARGVETRMVRAAARWMRGLAEEQDGIVRLCVLIGGQVLTLVMITPGRTLQENSSAEAGVPVTATSAGSALLLDWPPDTLDQLGVGDGFGEQVERVRSRGHAVHQDTDGSGRSGVAAPIRDFRGIVLAAIELAVADDGAAPAPGVVAAVRAAADALSRDLGHDAAVVTRV
jgi:DNA-binding IclR family transcriptional regulator